MSNSKEPEVFVNENTFTTVLSPDILPIKIIVSMGEWDGNGVCDVIKSLVDMDSDESYNPSLPIPPADGVCFMADGLAVVWVCDKPTSAEMIALLGHEALHAVFGLLKEVGMKPSKKSEESYTYLLQYIIKHTLVNYKAYEEILAEQQKPKRAVRRKRKTSK